ncbi:hypothetical protein [Aquincola tertiaricarbonis]|uniref:hypothetical protein n=1 Tax=Aquincola tertiaricarbonis TaxID=391953 RepID=UPI00061540D1|nr:hypothetical protein [Aquincola tertiaricarbonis]
MNDTTMLNADRIQPVEACGHVRKCMGSPQSYASSFSYGKPTALQVATKALQELEAARQRDIAVHERNKAAIEINTAIHDRVVQLMEAIGMPRRYSLRDTSSRSARPRTVTLDAGYLTDLKRECRTDDGFDFATSSYEQMLRQYRAYEEQAKREDEQARRAEEQRKAAEVERRKADMVLAAVLLRYGLPIESTWSDVMDALRVRDQRLDLAVAMEQTRGDWSEGAYRVRDALDRFEIRCTEDKDIANDVLAGLTDFCDGRVFRDATWSYDRLYASVADQQLATDVRTAARHVND